MFKIKGDGMKIIKHSKKNKRFLIEQYMLADNVLTKQLIIKFIEAKAWL